jgi:hypothetical protein
MDDIIISEPESIISPKVSTETVSETGNEPPIIDMTYTIKNLKDALLTDELEN